jgi:cell division protein FtsZ
MKKVDSVLAEGVNSISGLISQTGYINADFNDAKSVMENAGTALMGIGRASGESRAEKAAREATTSPLLDMSIEGATGVLYNVVGSDLTLQEISLVSELIKEAVDPAANIKFGAQIDPEMGEEISITIVATGFDEKKQIFTRKQQEYTAPSSVRTFGFDSDEDEITEVENEDSLQSFTAETPQDDLPSFEEDETPDVEEEKEENIKDNIDIGEDPLDVPAFMRKKGGK